MIFEAFASNPYNGHEANAGSMWAACSCHVIIKKRAVSASNQMLNMTQKLSTWQLQAARP